MFSPGNTEWRQLISFLVERTENTRHVFWTTHLIASWRKKITKRQVNITSMSSKRNESHKSTERLGDTCSGLTWNSHALSSIHVHSRFFPCTLVYPGPLSSIPVYSRRFQCTFVDRRQTLVKPRSLARVDLRALWFNPNPRKRLHESSTIFVWSTRTERWKKFQPNSHQHLGIFASVWSELQ